MYFSDVFQVYYNDRVVGLVVIIFVSLSWFILKYWPMYRIRSALFKGLRIITFANHKGGVGKTTQVFFLSKYIAQENQDKDIVLIDGSIYNDLTRLCVGETSFKIPTVEELIQKSTLRYKDRPKSIRNISLQLKTVIPQQKVPDNLYLITNVDNIRGNVVNHIKSVRRLLGGLQEQTREVVIICDTDGGMMHTQTCFAIGLSDSIVIPIPPDTQSIRRMCTLVEYIYDLRKKRCSWTFIRMYIYNNLPVSNNKPTLRCTQAHLPFTVNNGVLHDIEELRMYLDQLQSKYPHIITAESCYGIRNGGITLQQAKTVGSPFMSVLSHGIDSDFRECAQKIMATCSLSNG